MSVIRVGSNEKFASGWENIFGSKSTGKKSTKTSSKAAPKKSPKKASAKKAVVKKSARPAKKAGRK